MGRCKNDHEHLSEEKVDKIADQMTQFLLEKSEEFSKKNILIHGSCATNIVNVMNQSLLRMIERHLRTVCQLMSKHDVDNFIIGYADEFRQIIIGLLPASSLLKSEINKIERELIEREFVAEKPQVMH